MDINWLIKINEQIRKERLEWMMDGRKDKDGWMNGWIEIG